MHSTHRACIFTSASLDFLCIFRVAGAGWPKGLACNNGGLHFTSSPKLVVAAHTPCQRRAVGRWRRRRIHQKGFEQVLLIFQLVDDILQLPTMSIAIVHHHDSHHNLAWHPIPQPRQMVVRCSKKHKGKENVVRTRRKCTHRTCVFLYFRYPQQLRLVKKETGILWLVSASGLQKRHSGP